MSGKMDQAHARMNDQERIHRIALSMLKGIGPVNARNLVAYCGGVEPLFTDPRIKRSLEKVPGIGPTLLANILDRSVLDQAARALEEARKRKLRITFYLDEDFPRRLKHAVDAPVLLFIKGNAMLDPERSVAIVGTRAPSEHGRRTCEELVEGLAGSGALIVSGLAYGIDIVAHRTALKCGLPTVACVAHGLDRLYPGEHSATARDMEEHGGLITELPCGSPFVPGNFPARNRLIAGLADCTVVVESGKKGGSLITADIANSYDREVFAYPGRATDAKSEGCNRLIQNNQAALVTSAADVLKMMEWMPQEKKNSPVQAALFTDLMPDEQALVDIIKARGKVDIDELCVQSRMSQGKAAGLLLNLEFNGVVRALPGKVYALN